MSLERPWALLALLPFVALYLVAAQRIPRAHPRRALMLALHAALALCLALAAAGLSARVEDRRLAVIVAVDRSRSMDHVPAFDARLRALLAELPRGARRGDHVGVLGFAAVADTALVAGEVRDDSALPVPAAPPARDESALEAGILHALGDVPAGMSARIVLISDGDETRGDARGAALIAGAADAPVDTVYLPRPPRRDVRAVRLRAPDLAAPGEPADLALVVQSDRAGGGRVELLRDGARIGRAEVHWRAGEDVVHLRDPAPGVGLHRYEARLVPAVADDDEVHGNEVAAGFVRVMGGARALVLSAAGGGEVLAGALRAAGMDVDLVGPSSAPSRAGEWARYDLVVLSDVRARELDPAALPLLREQVRELGGGLLMVGSDRAFGPGGYGRSPVEDVLPVTLDLRQHRTRASAALAIMIDRSGSMSAPTRDGRTKIDLANEGAARAAAMLDASDRVAIAHIDTSTDWTWRMGYARDPLAIARAARMGTAGGGGIATDVALRDAYDALDRERTTLRHVILLADGDDAEQSERCGEMVSRAFARRITTSVVAIGRGHDEPHLAEIARRGGGRYYLTEDARTLPQIFTEETVIAARNPIREEAFRPRFVRSAEVLRGIDPGEVPSVQGYVVTEARPRAEVLARALDDDPWLARWSVGAGRGAVLTSDVDGRWTRALLAWPGAASVIGQLGLWLARGAQDAGTRATATATDSRVTITVDATTDTGRWDSGAELEAHVVSPAGITTRVALEARAAGRYEAVVDAPQSGTWLVSVVSPSRGVLAVTGAEVTSAAELGARAGDPSLLAEVSARSGGRVRNDLRGLWDEPRRPKRGARALEPALLWASLALLLAHAAARRPPPIAWRRAVAWRPWASRRVEAPPAASTDALVEAVRARREKFPVRPVEAAVPLAPAPPPPEPASTEVKEPSGGLDDLVARKRARKR